MPVTVSLQHGLPAQHRYFHLFGQAQQASLAANNAAVHVPATLALQGGGSRGVWQAGVLAELLESDVLRVAAAFGASAGAINAAAYSVVEPGSRDPLLDVWLRIGHRARTRLTPAIASLPWTMLRGFTRGRRPPLISGGLLRGALAYALPGAWTAAFHTYVYATSLPHSPTRPWVSPPFEFQADPGGNAFRRFSDGPHALATARVLDVLAASACLPLVAPIRVGEDRFADGGLLANLPATFLQHAGALSSWGFTLMLLPTPPDRLEASSDYIGWKTLELLHAILPRVANRSSRVFVLAPSEPLGDGIRGVIEGFKSDRAARALYSRGRSDAQPFVRALRAFFLSPVPNTDALRAFDLTAQATLPMLPETPPSEWWMPWVGRDFASQIRRASCGSRS